MKPNHTRRARGASFALAMILSLALFLGFLNAWHPAFDTLSHFRAHLAVLLGLTALPFLLASCWMEATAVLALAMVSLISISSPIALLGFTSVRAASEPADNPPTVYRLLQLNLLFDNRNPDKVFSLIGRTQPDVVTFNEVSEKWMLALGGLSAVYPYRLLCPPLAILSRRSFGPIASQRCYDETLAMVAINFGGHEVTVAAMHLGWPWPYSQLQQVDEVAPALRTLPGTVILAGDLNAAEWSVAASRVAETGQLTLVPGVGPTWLYRSLPNWLRPWIGLPIDHVLFKGNVVIHSAKVQEEAGSDHLPVLVEFSVITNSAGPREKMGRSQGADVAGMNYPMSKFPLKSLAFSPPSQTSRICLKNLFPGRSGERKTVASCYWPLAPPGHYPRRRFHMYTPDGVSGATRCRREEAAE